VNEDGRLLRIVFLLIDHNVIGGIQTHLMTLAGTMAGWGHEVTALLPAPATLDGMVAPLQAEGVRVIRLPDIITLRLRLHHQAALWWHLMRLRPDVLHIQQSIPGYDRKGMIAGWLARVPLVVVTEHDEPRPETERQIKMRHFVDRITDGIITVSRHSRALQLQMMGRPANFVHIVLNGIDLEEEFALETAPAADIDLPAKALVVGSLCRLEKHKGVDDLLRAAALLADQWPTLYLLISGEGPEEDGLRRLAAELGLTARVRFFGPVSRCSGDDGAAGSVCLAQPLGGVRAGGGGGDGIGKAGGGDGRGRPARGDRRR
jgi:glycosyltransferase involved in cell wall biosynthesis